MGRRPGSKVRNPTSLEAGPSGGRRPSWRLTGLFLDRLRARQLLQVFNRVGAERAFFNDASTDLKQRTLNVVSLAFLSSSVLDFFTTLSIALVAVFVGFSLLGEISFGSPSNAGPVCEE